MNADELMQLDEPFTSWLVACDEAMAEGSPLPPPQEGDVPSELQVRRERGAACLKFLEQYLPVLSGGGQGGSGAWEGTPGSRLGRFHIRRQLGYGGFGVVFLAHDPLLNRDVALKIPHADALATPAQRRRFQHEAHAAARLDHPHVVPVYETGEVDRICYIASAYCPGINLADWLRQRTEPVPGHEAARLVADLADGIHHAHTRGVLHRDLKPANILLQGSGDQGSGIRDQGLGARSLIPDPWFLIPKITDFGLAKQLGENDGQTHTGTIIGTASYMAPEQAEGKTREIGTAADVYALGAILYELLTGLPPFQGETALATLELVRSQEPVWPGRLEPKAPRDLATISLRCLQKDPQQRYASAAALADDLRRFLAGAPILARPVGELERLWRWCRRNPALAGASTLAILGLVTVAALSIGFGIERTQTAEELRGALRDANHQRVLADQAKEKAQAAEKLAAERLARVEAEQRETKAQKERAQANARKARAEKRSAYAVRDFLQNKLLLQADTQAQADALLHGGGLAAAANRKLTIRQLLDRAAAELAPDRIEANFPRQPLLQAEILTTVGNTYRGVGEYGLALSYLERAARRSRQVAPDDPLTLTTLHNLAGTYLFAGKLPEAIKLFEQVRPALETKLGPDHPKTLNTLTSLAAAYRVAGKVSQAIKLLEQVRTIQQRKVGPDHPDTLATSSSLAAAYYEAGRLPEAINLCEQVRAASETKLGPDHPSTLSTLDRLAVFYQAAGRLPEAIKLFERVRPAFEAKLGPSHPFTLASLNNLAVAYYSAGRLPEATRLLEQVRPVCETKLGLDHPSTLATLHNLAGMYLAGKQLDKSIPLFEDVLKRQAVKLGRGHQDTVNTMANLAGAYRAAGRLEQAIPLLEEAHRNGYTQVRLAWVGDALLETYTRTGKRAEASRLILALVSTMRKQFPPESPQLADMLAVRGKQLLEISHYADAEPLLRECLAVREKLSKKPVTNGAGSARIPRWQVASAKSLLGGALLGRKKYADAEPLLLAGARALKKDEMAIPPTARTNVAEAMSRLIELYQATGKTSEAVKWREVLAARMKP
jgi:tetratricopeptide (TPR) repeat protein